MKGIFYLLGWALVWVAICMLSRGLGLIIFPAYAYFTFAGSDKREVQALDKLSSTLMNDEEIVSQAVQHRIFALWHRRVSLAITNSRIVVVERGLLGGFTMKDIQWKDLADVKIDQNVLSQYCGSNLVFAHYSGSVGAIEVAGIPDREASEIYSKSQAEEQAWEEKRRVRAIEEKRAASGGVTIHSGPQSSVPTAQAFSGNAMLEQIENAKRLLDSGVISDAEFQEMKAKIISAS
ncbi:MAG: hypothetical protein EBS21_05110 [Sphingomonadaceae bacterium]|nr:hypothetical protein [Sphingomonadaceae bacterium]